MLPSLEQLPKQALIVQFAAFMLRSLHHLEPSNCIVIHRSQYARDAVVHLLIQCHQHLAIGSALKWRIVNVATARNWPKSLSSVGWDANALIVLLLPVADIETYVTETFDKHSFKTVRHLFFVFGKAEHQEAGLCQWLVDSHINGVLVRLTHPKDSIAIVVWNGYMDPLDYPAVCTHVLTEPEFYAHGSRSATIFGNRLRHLDSRYKLPVLVFPSPPGIFVVGNDYDDRSWRRLAGTDVSLLRLITQQMRVDAQLFVQFWDVVDENEDDNFYDRTLNRMHIMSRTHHEERGVLSPFDEIHNVPMNDFIMVPYMPFRVPAKAGRVTLHGGIRYHVLVPNDGAVSGARVTVRRMLAVCLWPLVALVFAVLRQHMRHDLRKPADPDTFRRCATLYSFQYCLFDTFARSLATSTADHAPDRRRSEHQLLFVLAVFSLLASII